LPTHRTSTVGGRQRQQSAGWQQRNGGPGDEGGGGAANARAARGVKYGPAHGAPWCNL